MQWLLTWFYTVSDPALGQLACIACISRSQALQMLWLPPGSATRPVPSTLCLPAMLAMGSQVENPIQM